VPFFFALNSLGLIGATTISGTGTGAKSCPRARRIGRDFIGNRVLAISSLFYLFFQNEVGSSTVRNRIENDDMVD